MPTVVKQQNSKPAKKRAGVLGRIAPVARGDKGLKVNIYGQSGTGKTQLACSFPKPVLLIGGEDGTQSVSDMGKDVKFVLLQESGEVRELVEFLKVERPYATVVLDSATSFQDIVLREILGVEELPAQRSWGMAKREQWGTCALQTKEYLRALLDLHVLGTKVVILAQERVFNSKDDDVEVDPNSDGIVSPFVASALMPSVTGWLTPACDYVAQTYKRMEMAEKKIKMGDKEIKSRVKTGKVEFCLRVGPHPVFTTKFRLPRGRELPESLVDPSYEAIEELIGG